MMSSGDEGETAEEAMARVTRVNAFVGKQNRDDDPEFFMVKVVNMTGKGRVRSSRCHFLLVLLLRPH